MMLKTIMVLQRLRVQSEFMELEPFDSEDLKSLEYLEGREINNI